MTTQDWDEIEHTGHNPTVYLDAAEEKYYESGKWLEDEKRKHPDDGCWNCYHYDGDRCMKEWNNLDPCYYLPDRDDKYPTDWCEDHDKDDSIEWDEYFEEE